MRLGDTRANKVLDQLLAMSEGDRINTLSVAKEYHDHHSLRGASIPAGHKLLVQLELAICELSGKECTHATA